MYTFLENNCRLLSVLLLLTLWVAPGVAHGSLLLDEDFNDGVADGWVIPPGGGNWQVVSGEYRRTDTTPGVIAYSYYGDAAAMAWEDYVFEADFQYRGGTNPTNSINFDFRFLDDQNYYRVQFGNLWGQPPGGTPEYFQVVGVAGGQGTEYTWQEFDLDTSVSNHIEIRALGDDFDILLNGSLLYSFSDASVSMGTVGVGTAHIVTGFDNITVAPVPEPTTVMLLGLGCAGLVARRMGRKRP